MIFKSNNGKIFSKEEAIDLMVSLSATNANWEKKLRGFYNSLSQTELQSKWDEYWTTWVFEVKYQRNLSILVNNAFI